MPPGADTKAPTGCSQRWLHFTCPHVRLPPPVGHPAGEQPREKIRHGKVKDQCYSTAVEPPKQVFSLGIDQILSGSHQRRLHDRIKPKASKLKDGAGSPGPRTAAGLPKIE